ncbi:peptidase [Enterococcus faecalis]|uniref:peptidase n=1 Tax=Enterococcus faecalis TaxID=1351 RepID=UPI001A006C4D|nr:peptidase [Enterococcus faecalis]EGO8996980.1 peptidase [Enterococcus faecalis]EGQ7427428.1 peptidase [Enterococcus faecalis]
MELRSNTVREEGIAVKWFIYDLLFVAFILGLPIQVQAEDKTTDAQAGTKVMVIVKESEDIVPHPNELIPQTNDMPTSRGQPNFLPKTNEITSQETILGIVVLGSTLIVGLYKEKRKNNE